MWKAGGARGRGGKGQVSGPAPGGLVAAAAIVALGISGAGRPVAAQTPAAGPDVRDARAVAVVERGLELMGGTTAVSGIERIRYTTTTHWQRSGFRTLPGSDRPSMERHFDVRDYTISAWRNTRVFGERNLVNVVRDSVAVTDFGNGPQPLSVAYVDEKAELFAYTPDRLLLALREAPDLAAGADTTLAGEGHVRVRALVGGRFDAEVFFHELTGAPSMMRFVAGHPNDYGLVPWGQMTVEVWYANWKPFGDVAFPTQWDVWRAGSPYKRMTIQGAEINPPFAADSFEISLEAKRAYHASPAVLPMHEARTIDDVTVEGGFAVIEGAGYPLGAVDVGSGWLIVGAGQAEYNLDRAREALREAGVGNVHGVLAAQARTSDGGVVGVRDDEALYTSRAAGPYVGGYLDGAGVRRALTTLSEGDGIGTGEHALRIADFHVPDTPGSILLFQPATGWLHAPDVTDAFGRRLALAAASEMGWVVTSMGWARQLRSEAPGAPAGLKDGN